jgi:predicted  nucleic acid-binding Zn-ribbon protein
MTEEEKKEFEDAKQELLDHSQRIKNNEDFVVKFEQDGIHLHEEYNKMKNTMKTVNNIIFKRLKSQDQQYDSVSTRIDKFEASITTSVQSNESTIQDVSSKVTKNENDIANVQTQIDQKVDDKVTSAVQLTKYEIKETVQSNATSISELRESLSSQNADVQSNTSAIAQITQDVNADIQQLSTAQTQFQTQVDKTVDDKVTTAVRSIQSQIDNSSAEQNTNVADIKTDFNSKLSNVNAQIQQLSTVQTQLKEGVNSTVESNIKYQLAILEEKFTTTINAQIEQGIQTLEKSVQQNVTNFLTVQDPSTTDPV